MNFELDERFVSKDVKENHYNVHVLNGKRYEKEVFQDINIDEYERMADELATKPIDNKRIFGYVSQDADGAINNVKWDKSNGLFVAYKYDRNNHIPLVKSCYVKSYRDYFADKSHQYMDEIGIEQFY